jgi:aminomethyltransferase
VLDAVLKAGRPHSIRPFGEEALMTLRIEAGLALIDVEWRDARLSFSDADCVTPKELGFGWMLRGVRDGSRRFVGSEAIRRELVDGTSRWLTTGIVVDWADWDRLFRDAGLFPPKSEHPLPYESMVLDDNGVEVGYCTSFVYSPVLQRHVGIARVRPDLAAAGTDLRLELAIAHHNTTVRVVTTTMPFFDPERKKA